MGETCSARLLARYQGRRWLAVYVGVLAPCLIGVAAGTGMIDDALFAFAVMGVPCLAAAYLCAMLAFGEAVTRIELRSDGISLRLPSLRGYMPFWPVQLLEARWSEVTALRRRTVRARMWGVSYDYVLHRIETKRGAALLFEALPDLWSNTRGASLNLPVGEIVAAIAGHAGLREQDEGEVRGGGLFRNILSPLAVYAPGR